MCAAYAYRARVNFLWQIFLRIREKVKENRTVTRYREEIGNLFKD